MQNNCSMCSERCVCMCVCLYAMTGNTIHMKHPHWKCRANEQNVNQLGCAIERETHTE